MTPTPPTYDDRIAGLRERRAIAFLASREALNDVCRDAIALASELAEKLRERFVSHEKTRLDLEQERKARLSAERCVYAFRADTAKTDLVIGLERELASTKRELEQERGRREEALLTIRRFVNVTKARLGHNAMATVVDDVNWCCESCDGSGEVMSSDTVTGLTCGECRGSGRKSPPPPVPPVASFPALPIDPEDERLVDGLMAKAADGRTERRLLVPPVAASQHGTGTGELPTVGFREQREPVVVRVEPVAAEEPGAEELDPENELCATCNYTWFDHAIIGSPAAACPFKPSGKWPEHGTGRKATTEDK